MASKNRPAAAQDKKRKTTDSGKDKSSGPARAEIIVVLTEKQASKYIKNSKVVTAQELARQAGVKTSAANRYLQEAVADGIVKRVGGYSGHWLYQPASS
ncbi:MAG: MarR family transcriptional regulator [Cenarchaeum sp. SB0665_bin_23]|nr:MarR family transcriptional regulator [Cenarchaeum sp. SB0667_bin_13]MXY37354.1 MarR family transcriptional regulator [Cenarchaeum sp. SB0664_bin_35]MXY61254.1 MarR family transcriptional regulator [Cenarchaeum sp. SB0665_bin_23]MXZ93403.1 MarR family transcriptional regulator [Cenarchaeum sp. SB0666_bin_15]MYB47469.1 MarR family transcriptional regulator [Cenarchaeum sp. SB0662_bin_33]MYC80074.1 MarR family transcriptional regulator [Cenarchaeum sp. SB0661_bin_35]MYD58322.1 MarR family tr